MHSYFSLLTIQFSNPYFNKHAIVVYPEGLDYKPPGHQWLGDPEAPPSSVIDNRAFTENLLDNFTPTFCIDINRIYAAGLSNGGGLVGFLACSPTLPQRISAFAITSGAFYTDASLTEPLFGAGCQPGVPSKKKIPLWRQHPDPNTTPIPQWLHARLGREECQDTRPKTKTVFSGRAKRFIWDCAGWMDLLPSTVVLGEPYETLRLD
ncbi:hypothetical protein V2W45_1467900 [Cenococcum geophilum]